MLNAGVDMFILGNNLDYNDELIPTAVRCLKELVSEGSISEKRIDESLKRINLLRFKLKLDE